VKKIILLKIVKLNLILLKRRNSFTIFKAENQPHIEIIWTRQPYM